MLVIPAIDLMGGKAIRLRRGERDSATVFSDEPWQLVQSFVEAGAQRIHVVDIDGAFGGAPEHRSVVQRIVTESVVPIQVGGGLRDRAALALAFELGAHHAVLGTAAVKDPDFAAAACAEFAGRIIIAVDARDGLVAVAGWAEATRVPAIELARRAEGWGASAILYTDVARDGMHTGPNIEATRALAEAVSIPVIASGGIGSLADLRALTRAGIEMCVVGRALYERRFTLADALAAAIAD